MDPLNHPVRAGERGKWDVMGEDRESLALRAGDDRDDIEQRGGELKR